MDGKTKWEGSRKISRYEKLTHSARHRSDRRKKTWRLWAIKGPKRHRKKKNLEMKYCGWKKMTGVVFNFDPIYGLKEKLNCYQSTKSEDIPVGFNVSMSCPI
jgi:hypothetical protein